MAVEGWLAPLTKTRFVRMGGLSCIDYLIHDVTIHEQSGRPLYKDQLSGIIFTQPSGIYG